MINRKNKKKENKTLIEQYNQNIYRIIFFIFLSICLTSGAYAWFYHEYISRGTQLTMGNIKALVKKYDSAGELLDTVGDTSTLIYESNLGNTSKNTLYVEIENNGSLDMEYYMTFQLDGTTAEAGTLYYRVYEITNDVKNAVTTDVYDTKLKAYAAANPTPENMETDQAMPVSNLTTITTYIENGTIEIDEESKENNKRYYRIDYGMYSSINTDLYNDSVVSVHLNVFATQIGSNLDNQSEGEVWLVENEEQFRNAVNNALSGDTIKLNADITVNGSVDLQRRVHLDANGFALNITGDLVWDFVELGKLNINTTGSGTIDIGGRLYINTPKSNINFVGENSGYDIYVADTITLNGLQNGEEDGVLLDNTRIIKNKVGNIPADLIIKSNTRINVGPNVYVGYIIAEEGSTNIEIINNGSIVQLQLQDMDLLPTFTKAQIYVYNLNVIQGVVGSSAIVLPDDATPYLGSNNGNTLIINSPYATEVSVSGSNHFTNSDVSSPSSQADVIPIDGETNAYIVYIRATDASLESLLTKYFKEEKGQSTTEITTSIASINKLIIYTSNAQYLENEDFDYMKSNYMSSLSYLDLSSAKVIDGTTVNRIKSSAMEGKTTLKTLILPNTVTTIGDHAFSGVPLGVISSSYDFSFLKIPASVTTIEDYAFDSTRFIEFESFTPPTIDENTFKFTSSGARLFVPEGQVKTYQETENYNKLYIHIKGVLSENKSYIIHFHDNNVGISLFISTTNIGTSLTIPNSINYNNASYNVVCIGDNAFSHITTPDSGSTIILPETVEQINSYAFYDIEVNEINIENTTIVGDYAFYNSNLKEVIIDKSTYVGDYAFYNNTGLIYATMEQLETLGNYAFANTDLYEVNLGTVSTIGTNVFENVNYLQSMYLKNTESITYYNKEIINLQTNTTLFNPVWIDNTDDRIRIYVPQGETDDGKTYIELYRQLFTDYEDYVYLMGTEKGSYNHAAINYDYGEYMIRSITYITELGSEIGIEIIDYHGADLTSTYQIPETFELDGVTLPVVSIGENAYRHVRTTGAVDIVNNNLISVGDYSFYGLEVNSITAENLAYVGNYAFGATGLTYVSFPNLYSLGEYALSDMDTLYSVNLGNVMEIGANAVSNNPNLAQIFITTIDIDNMNIASNAFDNIGTNIDSRLRIYVPEGDAYIEYYKKVFTNFQNYVYPTGTIVGAYPYLPYNIGAYAVREITLKNREGTEVTGWEIIEYHGENLDNTYNVPTSFTINGVTQNVISIGDNAYIHTKSGTDVNANISNNNLINIGNHAFENVSGINSLEGNNILTIGDYAFNNSSLTVVDTPNLKILGKYALSNMPTLYKTNLGIVSTMKENSLYNLDNLSQVFFMPTEETLMFDKNAITDVGSLTNNRIRFYVSTKDYDENTNITSDIDLTASYNSTYTTTGNGVNRRYRYTVTVTITNNNDVDAASWEVDMSLGTNGQFSSATNAEYTTTGSTVTFSNTTGNGTIDAGGSVSFTVVVVTTDRNTWQPTFSNCGGTHIDIISITVGKRYVDTYKNLFKEEYQDYFYVGGTIIGNYEQVNIPYDIGEYSIIPVTFSSPTGNLINGVEFIEYHGADLNNSFIIPESIEIEGNSYPVVKIGDKAFKFASMNGNMTIDIANDSLIYIGEEAFNGLGGIRNLLLPNVEYIGSYAFNSNKLYTVKLDKIVTISNYAFANNDSLNYIDLGNCVNIGEGALYNNVGIEQIFFRSTSADTGSSTMNITVGSNAFYNVGTNIGSRLRIYVPNGNASSNLTYVDAYKNVLPTNLSMYIYPTGYLVGNFTYGTLPYDIAQYSVRKVTIKDINNNDVTGWEIIEYHGDDINSSFSLPDNINVNTGSSYENLPLVSISDYAFANVIFSSGYILELPTNLVNIGDYAYYQRPISQIKGNYVTRIGKYAFAEIENLSSVEFTGVKTVDDYAFYNCPVLATTILGTNVTYIGTNAFYYQYTTARRELYLDVTTPPETGDQPFPARQSQSFIFITYYTSSFYIYVPASAVTTYQETAPYSDYHGLGLGGNTTNILSYSMSGGFVYNIINGNEAEIASYKEDANGTITIPEEVDGYTVTSIKAEAFDTCTNTTGIIIPSTVNKIGNGFLSNNVTITTIQVDENNEYFTARDGVLFDKDVEVLIKYPSQKTTTNYTLPNSVVMIATESFANNTELESITLPESLLVVSFDAFIGCTSLYTVTFNGDVPFVTGYDLFKAYSNPTINVPREYITNYQNYMYLRDYTFTGN